MTQPDTDDVATATIGIATFLLRLQPGPLADLRRMTPDRPAAAFWRLASRHPTIDHNPVPWMTVVQALAILAPKGDPGTRPAMLHNHKRRFGAVLCDGGDPGWPSGGTPRPVVSELRLMRLLASRGDQRHAAIVRTARTLSRTLSLRDGGGIDAVGLAWACLAPNRGGQIASDYYARLDRAQAKSPEGAST